MADFYRNRSKKDGLSSWCKDCTNESNRLYLGDPENKAKIYAWCRANARKYYQEHAETIKAYQKTPARRDYIRKYKVEHREEIRRKGREYWKKNKEAHRENLRNWRANNPEQSRAKVRRRRAKRQAIRENFTASMARFCRAFWGNRCAVCGHIEHEGTVRFPIDHWFPLSLGNALTLKIAVLMCNRCNCRKGYRLPTEIYDEVTIQRIESRLRDQWIAWIASQETEEVAEGIA
ncbi:hypothetical protein LCGC14_1884900 [marine sediment metagenome]|uniref:HNH endonuclease 5 domain-containing protein n=1 Tax=marine sediment metagenome TaxID=412755 RepID=A0A0F9GPL0_9ZZZZ